MRGASQCHQSLLQTERRLLEIPGSGLFADRTSGSRTPFARPGASFRIRKRQGHPRGNREIPLSGIGYHFQRTATDRQNRQFLSHLRDNRILTFEDPVNHAVGSFGIHRRVLRALRGSEGVLRRAARKGARTRIRGNRALKETLHQRPQRRQPECQKRRRARGDQHAGTMNRGRRRQAGDGHRGPKNQGFQTRKPDDHAGSRRTRFRMTGERNGDAFRRREGRYGKRPSVMRAPRRFVNRKKLVRSEINS